MYILTMKKELLKIDELRVSSSDILVCTVDFVVLLSIYDYLQYDL